jgi:phosphopantetheinyl transferase (holo-ACP synthase)
VSGLVPRAKFLETELQLMPVDRWALKEAAYKAIPSHLQQHISWKTLDVNYLASGAPTIRIVFSNFPTLPTTATSATPLQYSTSISGSAKPSIRDVLAKVRKEQQRNGLEGIQMMASLSGDAGMIVGVVVAMEQR